MSGQFFGVILSFHSNVCFYVVLYGYSLQKYPVNTGVSQGSIHGVSLFLLYIHDFSDYFICNVSIYADDSTL